MPSVGMRRTTRVFGVVKGAVGARVLRSGRRLWPESADGKLKKGGERDEWYSFVDSKGSSGKQIGWSKSANPKREFSVAETRHDEDHGMPDAKDVAMVVGGNDAESKMFGIVYSRRRKRKPLDVINLDGKKFGIHFTRRTKRKKVEVIVAETYNGFKGLSAAVISASCSEESGFAGFLCSILRYMKRVSLDMAELSGFLLNDPIRGVYASHGVNFLWDPPSTFGPGMCKFFGSGGDVPLFTVNFSAIPSCFRSFHVSISLKHHCTPPARVNNLSDEQTDSDDEVEVSGGKISCLSSNTKSETQTSVGRIVLHLPLRTSKSDIRLSHSRNGLNARGIRKTRSSLKSRRARNPSLASLSKNNGALASDLVIAKKNGFPFSSVVSSRKLRRSGRRQPAQVINDISTVAATSSASTLTLPQDIDSSSCPVNLLIIESDKCFREDGATVVLEPSASGEWCLTVKRDGLVRHTHKANEVMKPPVTNRFTHATIWTGDNGWRLEFSSRPDWLRFKDLYKECFDRNKQAASPASPAAVAVKIIPVPGVQEVPDYEGFNLSTFSRPTSYITMNVDEVARVLLKKTANYDMDCEDEEWLCRYNNERQSSGNGPRVDLSEDSFELMIDTFEKAFYNNPHDFSNEKPETSLCVDMAWEDVEAVYSYWMKKRKHKRSALIRALQLNQPKRAPLVPKPALRKKRSFKRQASHHGRGKQPGLLQALVAEREALEEQKSLRKLEEAMASASRSLELAVLKRQRAQFLMGNADLAAYRATMAVRIAVAAEAAESADGVAAHFLD